jgi:hypothetical protein
MGQLCNGCLNYSKEIDEFRQRFDDVVVIGSTEPEKHYCPMYDDNIPAAIFYENAECEFFIEKGEDNVEMQA